MKRRWLPRIRFSLRTMLIAVLLAGSGMLLWHNRGSWALKLMLDHHSVRAISFSANDRLVAVGHETVVRVWDVATGRQVAALDCQLEPDSAYVQPMFSTDGKWLATGCASRGRMHKWAFWRTSDWAFIHRVRGWEYDDFSQQFGMSGHIKLDGEVIVVDYDDPLPDDFKGSWVQSPDENNHDYMELHTNEGRLYDRNTHELALFPGQSRDVFNWAFSWDGKSLLTSGVGSFLWQQRRPTQWWGIAWLWEFWLTLALSAGLVWTVWRDRRVPAV